MVEDGGVVRVNEIDALPYNVLLLLLVEHSFVDYFEAKELVLDIRIDVLGLVLLSLAA